MLSFPTNTIAAIVVAMIGTSVGVWFNLAAGLRQLAVAPRVEQRWRWGVAAILSTWLLIVLAVAWFAPGKSVVGAPYIATFLTLWLLGGTLPLLISPVFRQLVRAIPATGLIGVHAIRVLGILFLALQVPSACPWPSLRQSPVHCCCWRSFWRSSSLAGGCGEIPPINATLRHHQPDEWITSLHYWPYGEH